MNMLGDLEGPILDVIPVVQEVAEATRIRRMKEDAHALTIGKCACGYGTELVNFSPFWTGRIHALDNVCRECVKNFSKMARVVCRNCRLPVVWLEPHVDSNGFEFRAGVTYHVTACPDCYPDVRSAVPVEKIAFDYSKSGSNLPIRIWQSLHSHNHPPSI